ncbi:ComEC/Rec2 family competence protein [Virgibacillus oceani]
MQIRLLFLSGFILLLLSACTVEAQEEVREVDPSAVFSAEEFTDELQVRFFHLELDETGKTGESILITTPGGQHILIDAGIPEVGPLVDNYLTALGVETIDIAMPSHPHSDHIGGYLTLFETKEIGKVISTGFPLEDSNIYQDYRQSIEENNIPVELVEKGDVIEVEENLTMEILHPTNETIENYLVLYDEFSAGIVNDLSMVVKLEYKDKSFLFTGDIYTAVESQLIDAYGEEMDADVVVAPHHGQHTSSSGEFLEAVSPEVTIIPINLLYSRSVYDNYAEQGSDVYASQFDGNVLIVSDGEKLDVYSEKENDDVMED